MIANSLTMVLM